MKQITVKQIFSLLLWITTEVGINNIQFALHFHWKFQSIRFFSSTPVNVQKIISKVLLFNEIFCFFFYLIPMLNMIFFDVFLNTALIFLKPSTEYFFPKMPFTVVVAVIILFFFNVKNPIKLFKYSVICRMIF